ncbi:tyrosine-type recombinase/integrase [Dermatobacter hominis]|uniref:tyrosine-type recombinase/integrase n=1 Tax=Dermatobacter hominis TaxID=2884263 RepID=UPI001D12C206|nr:site-specific integrase [Dermatobacter hominis]UDY36272.1 site-specific integrase [Dermatobacter hominis]
MRGTVRHLGGDRYQLRVDAGNDPVTGKRRQLGRVHRGTPTTAQRALRALIREVEDGTAATSVMTVDQLLQQYLAGARRRLKPSTVEAYRYAVEAVAGSPLGTMRIDRVKVSDVERFLDAMGDRPSMAALVRRTLRAAWNDAIRLEQVTRNPVVNARAPQRPPSKATTAELPDVLAAIAAAPSDLAVLLRVAIATGARRGELLGLQWGDVDLDVGIVAFTRNVTGDGRRLHIGTPKTGKVRSVSIDDATVAALKAWRSECQEDALAFGVDLKPTTWIWSQRPDGRDPWWPDTVTHRWATLRKKVPGLEGVRFHDLRHTNASVLIAAGVDPVTVAERLGHSTPVITLGTYSHALPAKDRGAATLIGEVLERQV